jgi:hypothetical protein
MDIIDTDAAKMLHHPSRADYHESLEEHLNIAARLSRALWELAGSPDLDTQDERSLDALKELASMVADHASAARYVFYKKSAASTKEGA